MMSLLAAAGLPVLLVFGLYHLLLWVNPSRIRAIAGWRRLALASALAHVLLATGFFVVTYFDFDANRLTVFRGESFEFHFFNRTEFWRMALVYDPAPTLALLGLFAVLDGLGLGMPQPLAVTILTVYLAGTSQWYVVGGLAGSALGRVWEGFKKGAADDEEWPWPM